MHHSFAFVRLTLNSGNAMADYLGDHYSDLIAGHLNFKVITGTGA